jgi:Uma2 family endonuclease
MAADPMVELRWRFTVEEYERMGEVGIFDPADRVELLDGEIVTMSPIGPKHAGVVNGIAEHLIVRLAGRATVIVQNPLRLLPRSEPQPDLVVARFRRDFYRSAHPTAEDVLLVIEVADSSLRTDRAIKLPIYARQGIVEVWIIDLATDVVHVHTDPVDGAYREVRTVRSGELLTPRAVPDFELTTDEILGG